MDDGRQQFWHSLCKTKYGLPQCLLQSSLANVSLLLTYKILNMGCANSYIDNV